MATRQADRKTPTGRNAACSLPCPRPAGGKPRCRSAGLALEPAPFPFRQPAPDPEPLVVLERVLQALGPHLAAAAHLLGFPGRAALRGEEPRRIVRCAQRIVLPVLAPGIVLADTKHPERDDLSHGAPPTLPTPLGTRRTLPPARKLHK